MVYTDKPNLSNVIIIGAEGLIGSAVLNAFNIAYKEDEINLYYPERSFLEISDLEQTIDYFTTRYLTNATIINCAVNRFGDFNDMYDTNVKGVKNLTLAAMITQSRLIHVSSDYVFSGMDIQKRYNPDDDITNIFGCESTDTMNTTDRVYKYTYSKVKAEEALLSYPIESTIVRTAWVYGPGGKHKPINFTSDIMANLLVGNKMVITSADLGTPTPSIFVAEQIALRAVEKNWKDKIIHVVGDEIHSRFTWALTIADFLNKKESTDRYKKLISFSLPWDSSNLIKNAAILNSSVVMPKSFELKELTNLYNRLINV
jgi:dTDP-4-dehydrorhamnose reductase